MGWKSTNSWSPYIKTAKKAFRYGAQAYRSYGIAKQIQKGITDYFKQQKRRSNRSPRRSNRRRPGRPSGLRERQQRRTQERRQQKRKRAENKHKFVLGNSVEIGHRRAGTTHRIRGSNRGRVGYRFGKVHKSA